MKHLRTERKPKMKAAKLFLLITILLLSLALATSCELLASLGVFEHVHEYSAEWSKDDEGHFKVCTSDKCGATTEKTPHSWGEPVITEAEIGKEGSKVYTCSVCNATKLETIPAIEHTHQPSEDWISDANSHWNTCEGCDARLNKSVHVWDDGTVVVEAASDKTGKLKYRCVVCERAKYVEIPALPSKMSKEEWLSRFELYNVRVDAFCNIVDLGSTNATILIDGEYAEVITEEERYFSDSKTEKAEFDFSDCYDDFNHLGDSVYYADAITVYSDGYETELTDVTVTFKDRKIDSISYVMELFGMRCDISCVFSEWGNVSVEFPTLMSEEYLAALNPENFYAYTMDLTKYDADYNVTFKSYVFDGEYVIITDYSEDDIYTDELFIENAGTALNPFYSTLIDLDATCFTYDATYGAFAIVSPSLIGADITYFAIVIEDALITSIYVVYADGSEETYEFYEYGGSTDEIPTLTDEEYKAALNPDNFYNYSYDIISYDTDMNYSILSYVFNGDSYTITRYSEDGSAVTNEYTMVNAGVNLNFVLPIINRLDAESFVYDAESYEFVLDDPSAIKDTLVRFTIAVEDGYLYSVCMEYEDGSADIYLFYDYGTSEI